jgi:hypothetical protein
MLNFTKAINPPQLVFIKDLIIYITKGYVSLFAVETPWLQCLVMWKNGKVHFLTWK